MMTSDKPIQKDMNQGRRDFLKNTWKILGVVAAAEVAFLTVNMLRPGKDKSDKKSTSDLKIIGNVDDFKLNSVTADRINKFYLVRESDGGFLALSLTCSHLSCSVLWDEAKNEFICPCHSSSFDKFGNVLSSPAPRPLDYYPVIIEEGKVKVDISRKIQRKKFDKNQLTYAL
jgi:cytochrome b6-f complex iron-sulfur subunit